MSVCLSIFPVSLQQFGSHRTDISPDSLEQFGSHLTDISPDSLEQFGSHLTDISPDSLEQFGSHGTDFHEILYLKIFRKSVQKIQDSYEDQHTFLITFRSTLLMLKNI